MTAVGDDFQAIYGWRAASARHILDFPDHFPEATVVTLESNYRSTQPILDVANALSAQAERAYPKRLRTDREGGVTPELVFCRDESAQASEIADRVLEARERGMDLRHQAALMRTSHDSALLELELVFFFSRPQDSRVHILALARSVCLKTLGFIGAIGH